MLTGTAGRPCRPWDTRPSSPGQLVDGEGPQTQARVAWYSWSTPRDLTHQLEAIRPGQLVDPTGHGTIARIAQEGWSNPWELGHVPQLTRRAGRPRSPSYQGLRRPGQLVKPAVPRTLHQSPGTASRPCGTSRNGPSPRHPGQLVDRAGIRAWARVAWERSSIRWDLVSERESPGSARQHCGPSDPVPSGPGQEDNPPVPRPRGQVTRDSWSTPRVHQHRPDYPGKTGRHRRPSDTDPSRLG